MSDQPLSFWSALTFSAITGLMLGLFTSLFSCRMLKLAIRLRDIALDALLGAVAFPLAFEIVWHIPLRKTTTVRTNGAIVTTIQTHYAHPGQIAVVLAVLLPLVHELVRFWTAKKAA